MPTSAGTASNDAGELISPIPDEELELGDAIAKIHDHRPHMVNAPLPFGVADFVGYRQLSSSKGNRRDRIVASSR